MDALKAYAFFLAVALALGLVALLLESLHSFPAGFLLGLALGVGGTLKYQRDKAKELAWREALVTRSRDESPPPRALPAPQRAE